MNIQLRLAWRNLWRHTRRTWLTVGAMIFSNVLLIFLVSIQFGMYGMMIDNSLRMFSGHIQIQHHHWNDHARIENSLAIPVDFATAISALPGVIGLARRAEAFVLASSEDRSYGIQVMGVEPESEKKISSFPGFIQSGKYLSGNHPQIILGRALAENLKIDIGDELTIFGSARDGASAAAILNVVGIFESGVTDLDRVIAQIPLQQFDQIFAMQGQVHRAVLLAENIEQTLPLQKMIRQLETRPANSAVREWNDLQPELQQAIQSDLASSGFMYSILIVLVAFSVLNTQLMSVLERTKEYGIMMALGLSTWRLGKLVMLETLLMSALGLLIGVAVGLCVVFYLQYAGFSYPGMAEMAVKFNLPARIYPPITLFSACLGPGLIFCACVLASLYPALRLHRLQAVQAMRAP